MRRAIALGLTAIASGACGGDVVIVEPDGGSAPEGPIVLTPVVRTAAGELAVLADDGELPILMPPGGGRVGYVGVRARRLDPLEAQLKAVLRDPASGAVRFDTRIVNLTADGGEARSDEREIATFSNIPLCPNQWSSADVFDRAYELEVMVTERTGRRASVALRVTPRCAEPEREAACKCMCKHGYDLGEPCGDLPSP
jgi:hypothetical protein